MPDHLQEAIRRLGAGYRASRQNLRDVAKLLGVTVQISVQYPGAEKKERTSGMVTLTTLCE